MPDVWTPPSGPLWSAAPAPIQRHCSPGSSTGPARPPKLPLKPRPSQPVLTRAATTMTTSPGNGGEAGEATLTCRQEEHSAFVRPLFDAL